MLNPIKMLLHSQKIIKQKGSLFGKFANRTQRQTETDKQTNTHIYTPGLKMTQHLRRLFSTHVGWLMWQITPGNLMPLALTTPAHMCISLHINTIIKKSLKNCPTGL